MAAFVQFLLAVSETRRRAYIWLTVQHTASGAWTGVRRAGLEEAEPGAGAEQRRRLDLRTAQFGSAGLVASNRPRRQEA